MGALRKAAITLAPKADTVPKGWKTAREWAEEEGYSRGYATRLICSLVDSGDWESQKFIVKNRGGSRPIFHYRPKP